MLICDKCGLRETIDIKTFITRLVQGEQVYDKRLYCQQCKQILTTIYVNSLFEKILHFDKTDLYTLFDIANKYGVQNKMLQGGGNDDEYGAIKKLPNEEYTQMIKKVGYKNCVDYMQILAGLINDEPDKDIKQTQQQIFSKDYDYIRQFINGLYPNQQNKDEITLVGFDKEPVWTNFKNLNNGLEYNDYSVEYMKYISNYSAKFRERFTSYIRYQKIKDNTGVNNDNTDNDNSDSDTGIQNIQNTNNQITQNDGNILIYQMFLIIAAIYKWCNNKDNINSINPNVKTIQIKEDVQISQDTSINIQLIKHNNDYNEYKIKISKAFSSINNNANSSSSINNNTANSSSINDNSINNLNKYLQSIYILFDEVFNIKGYSLLHGILYIMTQQQPVIDVNIISSISSNDIIKTQLSTLFKLIKLTYDTYQTFGQHYISTSNENKKAQTSTFNKKEKAYMFIEFYKLFQMNIYDRYNLIWYTLFQLIEQTEKGQIQFQDFKENFDFEKGKNLLEIAKKEIVNGKKIDGKKVVCEIAQNLFNQFLKYFNVDKLLQYTNQHMMYIQQIYVVLLMVANYLYNYDDINSVRENEQKLGGKLKYLLQDVKHLSSSFKDKNDNFNIYNKFNIYCLLFYISLKIYLDKITTYNEKNPNKQIQIDKLTEQFIDLLYNTSITSLNPQINTQQQKRFTRKTYQQNSYEFLTDLILYILKRNNSKTK